MNKNSRIYVAGHEGMVGSAIVRRLQAEGYENIITRPRIACDLRIQSHVARLFQETEPEYVFLAAAKVGGIAANQGDQSGFLYDNLMIQANVIHACVRWEVNRLVNLGSSCIYPKNCPQPMAEHMLLSSPLEETNEGYAIAKLAGLKLAEKVSSRSGSKLRAVTLLPCNLYGPNDNFDLETSHVVPALIRKVHDSILRQKAGNDHRAAPIEIWGSGNVYREFMHVDDCADACLFVADKDCGFWLNVGWGYDLTISKLAYKIAEVAELEYCSFKYDRSRPDGVYQKRLDVAEMTRLGWRPKITLEEGLKQTYQWYVENEANKNEQ